MRKLVAYFSVSGVTKRVAADIAKLEQADLFEIVPEELYTAEDVDYTNKASRCSVEMADLSCRPKMKACDLDVNNYDTIFVGFPIWWGREPSIVDTFLDSCNFAGKKIVPFCTSGGSGIDGASKRIAELTGASVECGIRVAGNYKEEELKDWAEGLEK